jgi:hypothetical protein
MKTKLQYALLTIASISYGKAADCDVPQIRENVVPVAAVFRVSKLHLTAEEFKSCLVAGVVDVDKLIKNQEEQADVDKLIDKQQDQVSKRLPPVIHFGSAGDIEADYYRLFKRFQDEEFMRYLEKRGFDAPVKIEPDKKNEDGDPLRTAQPPSSPPNSPPK